MNGMNGQSVATTGLKKKVRVRIIVKIANNIVCIDHKYIMHQCSYHSECTKSVFLYCTVWTTMYLVHKDVTYADIVWVSTQQIPIGLLHSHLHTSIKIEFKYCTESKMHATTYLWCITMHTEICLKT